MPELKLGIGSPPKSTGPHKVKLLAGKEVLGRDFKTRAERRDFRILVEENEVKKTYQFPILGEDGKPHYLLIQFANIPEGSEVILEMKREGARTFISMTIEGEEGVDGRAVEEDTIQLEEKEKESGEEDWGEEDMF